LLIHLVVSILKSRSWKSRFRGRRILAVARVDVVAGEDGAVIVIGNRAGKPEAVPLDAKISTAIKAVDCILAKSVQLISVSQGAVLTFEPSGSRLLAALTIFCEHWRSLMPATT
jgi:hypothetical protein